MLLDQRHFKIFRRNFELSHIVFERSFSRRLKHIVESIEKSVKEISSMIIRDQVTIEISFNDFIIYVKVKESIDVVICV